MEKYHVVAVIGGAASGSEAAKCLAQKGVRVVVFEQNPLPYGKIIDGLPRWHEKLREKECRKIDEKIQTPGIDFVPCHKLGKDIQLEELLSLGFSAVVFANGAWKDRPLRAEGLEDVKDLSFCYQNPFIHWFNHYHEEDYNGPVYPIRPGAVIVGGGLASIDVIKVCQLEMTRAKLAERGIEVDVVEMEHRGIDKTLAEHNLKWEDLGLAPAKLFYRRRVIDMPLASLPPGADEKKVAQVQKVRQKIIDNATRKFFFEVHPLHLPKKIHVNDQGSVSGVTFVRTEVRDGRVHTTDEEVFVETSFVVSSIGSIPEPLPGIEMEGELYPIESERTGKFRQYDNVFGVGNAVTGKGNIQVSVKHGRYVAELLANCLEATGPDYEAWIADQEEAVRSEIESVYQYLSQLPKKEGESLEKLRQFVISCQKKVGYTTYSEWQSQWKK